MTDVLTGGARYGVQYAAMRRGDDELAIWGESRLLIDVFKPFYSVEHIADYIASLHGGNVFTFAVVEGDTVRLFARSRDGMCRRIVA